MGDDIQGRSAEELYREGTERQFQAEPVVLGPWTSFSVRTDPKHVLFVLSRYKFCAQILAGKGQVLEVGGGDGIGVPLVAQTVGGVTVTDWDERLVASNKERLGFLKNVNFVHFDETHSPHDRKYAAAYAIDVIEHLEPRFEAQWAANVAASLEDDGMFIIGTPNVHASAHASPQSAVQHINLKDREGLVELLGRHFENVLSFSMNDEVIHTGYPKMAHYLFAIGIGKKDR